MPIPLRDGGELVGELRVGETASGAPLDTRDRRLLELSAAYIASALRTGRREDEQATELAHLAEARAAVEAHAADPPHRAGRAQRRGPGRARLRPGSAADGARRDADRALGRRQGRQPPGAGPVRVPLRPRRAGRGQGRGAGAHLARRRPGAGGPRVPPDDGGPARDPGPGQATGWRQRPSSSRTTATGSMRSVVAWSDVDAFLATLDAAAAADGPPGRGSWRRHAGSTAASTSTTAPTTATASSSRSGGSCSGPVRRPRRRARRGLRGERGPDVGRGRLPGGPEAGAGRMSAGRRRPRAPGALEYRRITAVGP